jgi:hypothetical protein
MTTTAAGHAAALPPLPLEQWTPTKNTLHL